MYLGSFWVSVKFFHQVHTTFGVHCPIDDAIPQAHLLQVNCNYFQHAGPLGHDHTVCWQRERTMLKYTGVARRKLTQQNQISHIDDVKTFLLPFLLGTFLLDCFQLRDDSRNLKKTNKSKSIN